MKEKFINWTPRFETAASHIEVANEICADYELRGYDLTLRQLYYLLVSRALIPNTERSYKNFGVLIDNARMGGLLDWRYIVDRTRNCYSTDGGDESAEDAIRQMADGYARTLWDNQPNHVEVWVEKEALAGIVGDVARELGINYFACRGYPSQSEMYSAGKRFLYQARQGKQNFVLHLGDHDPSGIDMTRDIIDRLTTFTRGLTPTVERLALNMEQIEQFQPPPNPAKTTDARYRAYQAEYGEDSWELDALDPDVLTGLIRDRTLELRDEELWNETIAEQETERAQLRLVSDNWDYVADVLADFDGDGSA